MKMRTIKQLCNQMSSFIPFSVKVMLWVCICCS